VAIVRNNDFSHDYHVCLLRRAEGQVEYNYAKRETEMSDWPGVSVFLKMEMAQCSYLHAIPEYRLLNVAYNYMDLVPKGRDEAAWSFPCRAKLPRQIPGLPRPAANSV